MPAKEKTLEDAFYETLKDVFYAEKASVKALKKSAKAAKSPDLKKAFETHGEESANQVHRLEEVFELIGKPARAKTCEASRTVPRPIPRRRRPKAGGRTAHREWR